jgi:hypothetical protein
VLREAVLYGAIALAALALLVVVVRRRPRHPRPAPPPPAARSVQPVLPPSDSLRDAVAAFRAHDDDASLDALRNLLFTRASARPGATLTDALQALGRRDPDLARAMAIAERVRFGPRAERAAARADLFDALAVLIAKPVRE